MNEILKTTMLEYEKSTFLIDLVKHETGAAYIAIKQRIEGKQRPQELKVNLTVAVDLIYVLQLYMNEVAEAQVITKGYFAEERQKKIVERYLKGVSVDDLVLQFGIKQEQIEQILFNKGVELADNKMPVRYRRSGRRRKPRGR